MIMVLDNINNNNILSIACNHPLLGWEFYLNEFVTKVWEPCCTRLTLILQQCDC